MEDYCVCCGAYVPEGYQVCQDCLIKIDNTKITELFTKDEIREAIKRNENK